MADYADLTNDDLRDILADYGQPTYGNKDELVTRIEDYENGVPEGLRDSDQSDEDDTPDEVEEVEQVEDEPEPEDEVEPSEDSNGVVVKMTRGNPTYEAKGHIFTQEHPFAVLSEEDADDLVANSRGFRPATQREVARYYGRE